MSALPPHVTGRPLKPLKPRRSKGNAETMSDATRQSHQGRSPSLPSQSGDSHPDRSHPGRQPSRPQAETDAHQLSDANFSMGLEVGRPRRHTEQTSHDTAQHALAEILRDADFHEANENRQHLQRRDSGFMESVSMGASAASGKQKNKAVPRDAKQSSLPSFAATHPSLYRQPTTESVASAPIPTLLDDTPEVVHNQAHQALQPPVKPWQIHSDPMRTRIPSPSQAAGNMRSREESKDSQQPNVVSPVRTVTMPFGSIMEIANDYDAEVDDDEYVRQD